MPREKLTELQFWEATDKTIIESLSIIQRTQPETFRYKTFRLITLMQITFSTKLQVLAESENIEANHLRFAKFLFQHYCQHLGLIHNYISAKSAFNFYVNERIVYLLETSMNIESVRETFYNELIQNTSLSTNYNFASIITEINKEIEHHTQQRYPITYTSKDKGKLQTPAVTSQKIQPLTWKKTRVKFLNNPSYHYILRSAINILSTDASTSNVTSAFGRFLFQNKQKKEDLLGPYGKIVKFTYQNPILKNPEIKTPNFQIQPNLNNSENNTLNIQTPPNQNNPNSEVINQYLSPVIIINQPPIEPIGQPIQPLNQQNQQLPPVPSQQQQQLLPSQQQQMAYASIVKLDKFNGKENYAQVWLNDMAKAITYFNNNNSINKLANIFTTIKQGDTEAVTTYLGCFHRNLHQIQAIQADYFTAPQILNQFIRELCSSILQQVRPMYPVNLPTTVTYAKDFEAAELEANHAQAVNLAMNGSSELDSKLKQFSDSINQKLEEYLADNHTIYQSSQWHNNQGNANRFQNQSHLSSSSNQLWQPEMHKPRLPVSNSEPSPELRPIPTHLSAYDVPTNLSTASLLNSSLSTTATSNLSGAAINNISTTATSNLSNTHHSNTTSKSNSNDIKKPKIENHPKLEIGDGCTSTNFQLFSPTIKIFFLMTPEDTTSSNQRIKQQQPPTNNIPPATITKNEFLDAIFLFKLEKSSDTPLFSGAAFEEKPIMAMYIDAKVDGHFIKLILDSGSADSIITQQLMDQLGHQVDCAASTRIITVDRATKTPIGEIDDFLIEVNGIVVPIKVLVIKATQYQVLVDNNWLSKTNTVLNWMTQELVLSQNSQHTQVPATCGHFKATNTTAPLINLKEEKPKPTWKAYQVSWTDEKHNELLPILS
ncbi:hypothetical protein G9A89_022648 [Geosiphon pyriformis]|nr:hypothetical protein G9A89_022648 [Geosiphon pyriformis]